MIEPNTIHHSDIFDLCARLDDASVDMILCDLPYGVLETSWDTIIPLEPMWEAFKRVIKPRGAIVLTATQPFASRLISSNIDMFKYELIWRKNHPSNHFNAKNRPLQIHENILIFSNGTTANRSENKMLYNPQGTKVINRKTDNYGNSRQIKPRDSWQGARTIEIGNYPTTDLYFKVVENNPLHPTQKPVALFEYLIKTYTLPDALVFDPCAGSGTTAIASLKSGRRYIVGDSSPEYFDLMHRRVNAWDVTQPTQIDENTTQLTLFEAL